jgi:hypothetical protein
MKRLPKRQVVCTCGHFRKDHVISRTQLYNDWCTPCFNYDEKEVSKMAEEEDVITVPMSTCSKFVPDNLKTLEHAV